MPIVNRVADLHNEIKEWRRDFHAHPELRFDAPALVSPELAPKVRMV